MSPLVKISVKKQDELVNYIPFKSIHTTDTQIGNNNVNFHIPTLIKEVKKLPKKERKSIKKQILTFQATVATFLLLPLRSMAENVNTTIPVTNLPKSAEGLPSELMELMIALLVIAVGAGVVLAAILLAGAGIGKMFRMKDANEWTTDILKGLVQVLIAVPVVFVIYYVANLIFSGSGWFVSPF